MKKLSLSIGILSWRGYKSLHNALKSYEKNGLNSMISSKFISLPEYTNEGINLSKKYGYKPGPELGKKLKSLAEDWVNNNFVIEQRLIDKSLGKPDKN